MQQIQQNIKAMKTKRITWGAILLFGASTLCQGQGITFVVDENLPAPEKVIKMYEEKDIAYTIINKNGIPREQHHVVKTSFEGERMGYMGEDNFFKCMVQAYADHRPVVLSPDVVWIIISQGFARYVNAHSEEMRDKLVFHQGKKDIIVLSKTDILSPGADWEALLNGFSASIAQNTQGEVADLMTSTFTTTGMTERIASQITLMEAVKTYFGYYDIVTGCGIPYITLQGTPDDWRKVRAKARGLVKYGMADWFQALDPILAEFVNASEGKPDQDFWQGIVKKRRVKKLKLYKNCGSTISGTTKLDGWFLKFFPDEKGNTSEEVYFNTNMPTEMVRVPFTHQYPNAIGTDVVFEVPMELWAGIVGVAEDPKTSALTPKIGWLARMAVEKKEKEK